MSYQEYIYFENKYAKEEGIINKNSIFVRLTKSVAAK